MRSNDLGFNTKRLLSRHGTIVPIKKSINSNKKVHFKSGDPWISLRKLILREKPTSFWRPWDFSHRPPLLK
jgi:hypothetical protein